MKISENPLKFIARGSTMKVSGIICEYNPFHNGHLHHIQETRRNGATHIVAVMSGNFVQRGDLAIIDKLSRARTAVKNGVDLVIELPVPYCLSSAENFAAGGVWLLNSLGAVDEISFGSECGNIDKMLEALSVMKKVKAEKDNEIRSIMEKGYTYPRALCSVMSCVDAHAAAILSEPNNTLGIEYLHALQASGSRIRPFTVKRSGAGHNDSSADGNSASAGYIRNLIADREIYNIGKYMPENSADTVRAAISAGETASLNRLERVILYKLRTSSIKEISGLSDIGQGLENRIYNARSAGSLEELFYTVKTKRYTLARIKRMILSLLIGITADDMTHMPPYGRILAMNENGREILARAKGKAVIPYAVSLARLSQRNRLSERFAELEGRASDIYGLALDNIMSAQNDFRAKIMIDME